MIERYSEARLPTPHGEFRCVIYRTGRAGDDGSTAVGLDHEEHVAMVMGDVAAPGSVLARVHSSCFTGEVLGSLRCDCRAQLDSALQRIASEGRGVVVYLVQEGRGIGLGNKVRAYHLQDEGLDTVEANLELGFAADSRSYELAAQILRDLGATSVRLMTNNPAKRAGLEQAGIAVTALEPHHAGVTAQNAGYLDTKRAKLGHLP
ncbi:MAG TPA: GTP cyclohydrolase II [Kofleriaceae bacterium]|jgi:3,4-dihydroxy 2-butanone 4-phosphate synthase/GTP cyclohydrolase II|nr:GTP cyclohydrolase II [Kofleriaceae bacterium]